MKVTEAKGTGREGGGEDRGSIDDVSGNGFGVFFPTRWAQIEGRRARGLLAPTLAVFEKTNRDDGAGRRPRDLGAIVPSEAFSSRTICEKDGP